MDFALTFPPLPSNITIIETEGKSDKIDIFKRSTQMEIDKILFLPLFMGKEKPFKEKISWILFLKRVALAEEL